MELSAVASPCALPQMRKNNKPFALRWLSGIGMNLLQLKNKKKQKIDYLIG
jgi:hypothetical protein